MASNRFHDLAVFPGESAGTHGEVKLSDCVSRKLAAQTQMGPVVFRDCEATACLFVQPMHQAGTKFAPDTAQVLDVMEQGINECSFANPCTRMNNHACRLINNQQMLIFEEDFERNVLGLKLDRFRGHTSRMEWWKGGRAEEMIISHVYLIHSGKMNEAREVEARCCWFIHVRI